MAVEREVRRSAGQLRADKQNIAGLSHGTMSTGRWTWEWTRSILVAFGLFLVIRTFLVEAFRIPTGSMESTLLVGDFLLVNKAVFGGRVPLTHLRLPALGAPVRGDIVVFAPPHDPGRTYVKRLVAMPRDTVAMRDKVLFVNGEPKSEPYVHHDDLNDARSSQMFWQCEHVAGDAGDCTPSRDNWGPLVVPDDRYMVLGDNRDDSEDSRYWGFIPGDALRGRPLFVYYSFDPHSARSLPWLTHVRWGRMGERVH